MGFWGAESTDARRASPARPSPTGRVRPALKRVSITRGWQRSVARRTSPLWRTHNVAMLHHGRCGSTVVAEMLGDHPSVSWRGEIFEGTGGNHESQQPDFAARTIERSCYSTLSPVYGFETKYLPQQHLRAGCIALSIDDYIALLRSLGFEKFVLVHRRNYLRRAVSVAIGRASGQWHSPQQTSGPTTIAIDVDAFATGNETAPLAESFANLDSARAELERALDGDAVLSLVYEDDVADDPARAYERVCEFLDLTPGRPRVKLQRTNPFPLESMILNFDEVRATLQGTPYAWMLED